MCRNDDFYGYYGVCNVGNIPLNKKKEYELFNKIICFNNRL